MKDIDVILTDIEGTTSSLSFVKEVLFPYARAHLPEFVRAHAHEADVVRLLDDARAMAGAPSASLEEVISTLVGWIDQDRKATPLKALQGMIWAAGYAAGDFRGHVYEDAARNLRAWNSRGLRLAIFSSGSVQAQKLLFAHSDHGDLTPLFSGYYDTTIGNKRERGAYERIASALGSPAPRILFLSDIREELDAARAAGMSTCWLVRDGVAESANAASLPRGPRLDPIAESANAVHPQASDFDAIL